MRCRRSSSDLQLWPYDAGIAFIRHLDEAGGTAQVDEALTTFPVSTEQILHPERWPNDVPQPVDVPDLGPALGDGLARPRRDDGGRGVAPAHAGAPAGRRRRRAGGGRVGRRPLPGVDRRLADGRGPAHRVGLDRGRAAVRRRDGGVDRGRDVRRRLGRRTGRRRVRERRPRPGAPAALGSASAGRRVPRGARRGAPSRRSPGRRAGCWRLHGSRRRRSDSPSCCARGSPAARHRRQITAARS